MPSPLTSRRSEPTPTTPGSVLPSAGGAVRALLVVHFAPLRQVLIAALEEIGCTVAAVASMQSAEPLLSADLAVAVLDFEMAASEGATAYALLRARAPAVPIIILRSRYRWLGTPRELEGTTELVLPFGLDALKAAVLHAVGAGAP